jgi:hypothetical protein
MAPRSAASATPAADPCRRRAFSRRGRPAKPLFERRRSAGKYPLVDDDVHQLSDVEDDEVHQLRELLAACHRILPNIEGRDDQLAWAIRETCRTVEARLAELTDVDVSSVAAD